MKFPESEKKRLKNNYGQWAVITGASSGIGYELAQRVAEAKLNVILNGRDIDRLQSLAKYLSSTYHIEVKVVAADISESSGIDRIIDSSNDLDIGLFIASAGYGTSGLFSTSEIKNEVNMLRVNCEALLSLTHYFSQRFAAQKRGGIILMSSIVAFQGVPFAAHYAATKAYVQTLAEALAIELKPFNIDVLSAAPGPVETSFGKRADMKMNMSLKPAQIGIPILYALGRNKTVLPGFLTKLLVYALRTVPRWGKIRIMEKVMGGMTKHQMQ